MESRIGIAMVICLCTAAAAAGQVVRFETTMGNFDMVMNPTHDSRLQGYVDNFLNYVNSDRYLGSWINRAADSNGTNFVLQMGGFFSHTKRPSLTIESTRPVEKFDAVKGVPAAGLGLSNTVGTVALALPSNPITNAVFRDEGTSEFFINAANNTFLDRDFTVFAKVPDMTVVTKIMDLATIDRRNDPLFAKANEAGAFTEVPVQTNGFQVFIKRAFIVTDTLTALKALAGIESNVAQSAVNFANDTSTPILSGGASLSGGSSLSSGSSESLLSPNVVPEPASLLMAVMGAIGLGFYACCRRR